ncbi:MAG: BREX-1 system phosphatase PglZ type B [bacterium]|nr:BREX-1 system phosphatase PglZ type B [bacterium]
MRSTTKRALKTICDNLVQELRSQTNYNSNVQVAPVCILWPDGERQFEPVIARLMQEMPELCVLGDYAPEQRTGPAIWLRLVIADKIDEARMPAGQTPIIYLPGVRRQDLRAVDECDEKLKPLAELQYRGTIWSQVNNKDWTILAFLSSSQGGLGLKVAQDSGTKNSLRPSLYVLLDERVDLLEGKHLDKDYFNGLIAGGDPVKNLLLWIDDPDGFQEKCDANSWNGFVEICKSQFKFDPVSDGPIEAGYLLAEQAPPWDSVWERFADAPQRFPHIPDQIRKSNPPPPTSLFDDNYGWPQWNERKESELRSELTALVEKAEVDAREAVIDANKSHHERRQYVWAELGMSPLAIAVEHLAELAEVTRDSLAGGTADDMAAVYANSGWRADDAVMNSLAGVQSEQDFAAVAAVIHAIYSPWAEQAALHLQKEVATHGYPGGDYSGVAAEEVEPGTCFFFVDGLRYDLAQRLCQKLEDRNLKLACSNHWATLPSVTASAKPAVSPVKHLLKGEDVNEDFYPNVVANQKAANSYNLAKLIEDNGLQRITKTEYGDPSGLGWCETGEIDKKGHADGWKLSRSVDQILNEVVEQIEQLFAVGWKSVKLVTDHGFLLLPNHLPESKLPASLAVNKWGRCAALKPGANVDEQLYPWFWNPTQSFALASGISTYRKRMYSHGGLSVQECVTMSITVQRGSSAPVSGIKIESVTWKQLRCSVVVNKVVEGLKLDIRTHAGNASTSEANDIKSFGDKTKCSVIIEDDDLEGHAVFVVVLDDHGNPLAQQATTVGGNG